MPKLNRYDPSGHLWDPLAIASYSCDSTPTTLEQSLRDHGDIVHLNVERGAGSGERGALQANGCNNQVVVHFALDRRFVNGISNAGVWGRHTASWR